MEQLEAKKPITISGIIGVVFGGIALLTSYIPIINNGSAIFGLVGAIFSAVALFATRSTGKKSGRILAVIALIISVVSIVVVLTLQAQWSAALS